MGLGCAVWEHGIFGSGSKTRSQILICLGPRLQYLTQLDHISNAKKKISRFGFVYRFLCGWNGIKSKEVLCREKRTKIHSWIREKSKGISNKAGLSHWKFKRKMLDIASSLWWAFYNLLRNQVKQLLQICFASGRQLLQFQLQITYINISLERWIKYCTVWGEGERRRKFSKRVSRVGKQIFQ